jgi:predicted ArsR family transcriptional regulator
MLEVVGQRQQALLRLLLAHKDGLTIDQLAARLAITRTAVREHVAALERDRLVAPRAALPSTGGRPSRPYALTARGHALFPKHYDLMAQLLLESLARRVGEGDVREELAVLGRRLAGQLKQKVAGATLAERAGEVAALMRDLGYEASLRDGEVPTIGALNCVFHELAFRDPTVCALDLALIGTLAGAEVEHRSCMARGDNECAFCLRPKVPVMDSDEQVS